MRIRLITLLFLILTACSPRLIPVPDPTQIPSPTLPQPKTASPESATPDRINVLTTKLPERVPPSQVVTPITGEVPAELLDSIFKDLSERVGTAFEHISVIQAQEIVWNDGSLGCPQPGMFYTQVLVNGYWVILEIDGKKFDYRATDKGYFFLCEDGISPFSRPSTPSS